MFRIAILLVVAAGGVSIVGLGSKVEDKSAGSAAGSGGGSSGTTPSPSGSNPSGNGQVQQVGSAGSPGQTSGGDTGNSSPGGVGS